MALVEDKKEDGVVAELAENVLRDDVTLWELSTLRVAADRLARMVVLSTDHQVGDAESLSGCYPSPRRSMD